MGEVARTSLTDFLEAKKRAHKGDPLCHLRQHVSNMGCPPTTVTTAADAATGPVMTAVDPKWSTNLKRINGKVGMRIKYDNSLSSTGPAMSPELRFMPTRANFMSNPPTPLV